ncbi:MAG: sporulation protein YunB [Oscillospiraceae bacterium]|nr:sporulation protein YunB [Oscillospiraceae bacterium]
MSDLIYNIKRRRLQRGKNRVAAILLLICGFTLVGAGMAFYRHFMPVAVELAEAEANNIVSAVINNAIAHHLAEGELEYSDIVLIEKDENGAVAAVMTDTAKVNGLRAAITSDVLGALAADVNARIKIPIGNLTGIKLLSGKGPAIPVDLVAASQTNTEFVNHFSTAGINQTCHRISVRVNAVVNLLLPGETVLTKVSAEVAIAETVIIGGVPDSYTFFEADEKWDENLERFDITS